LGVAGWTLARRLIRPGRYAGIGPAAIRFLTSPNPFVAQRAGRELGWRPPWDTGAAIRRSVAWFRENETPGP
jgi:nucleoside-diphosphate-sugar epimerase